MTAVWIFSCTGITQVEFSHLADPHGSFSCAVLLQVARSLDRLVDSSGEEPMVTVYVSTNDVEKCSHVVLGKKN